MPGSLQGCHIATGLKKFLKKNAEGDTLAVLDSKLGSIIKEKLNIPCIFRYLHLLHVTLNAAGQTQCYTGNIAELDTMRLLA